MQEDHVSMGWSAARKLRAAIDGLRRVLAIEILTAARGIELRGEGSAPAIERVLEVLRERTPGPGPDRVLAPEISDAVDLLASGELLAAAAIDAEAAAIHPARPSVLQAS
jgi:histidine ammonia-lyase